MNKTEINAQPGQQGYTITREFDAPRELVFQAHVDPKLLAQWLGPRDLEILIEQFDPQPGGAYRYINRDKGGNAYSFYGVFHDVTAPERIIQTFEFLGLPERGHVCLSTQTFESLPNNRTRLTVLDVYQSGADRDGMIASGMESGVVEGYERLDELLAQS